MALLRKLLVVVGIALAVQAVTSYLLTRLLSGGAALDLRASSADAAAHHSSPIAFFDNSKSGALGRAS